MASMCSICCEPHNNSTRQNVKCEYGDCGFEACKMCVRQYLLTTANEPHCMNCKKSWGQEFLVRKLNRSFVTSDYKVHRSKLLCEREISKLPETMTAAENYRDSEKEFNAYDKCQEKINELNNELKHIKQVANQHWRNGNLIRFGGKTEQAKREFIMPCQNDGCRGFLSTAYKCGLCSVYTCPKCLEVIGHNKDDPHDCKKENIQSAEMIKKDTKPCPCCGTRIFKIDGCDQMWCSNCHKAWSWRTGKIDNGVVHNPHYYEFQRNGGATIPRAPGDEVCGGLLNFYTVRVDILSKIHDRSLVRDVARLHHMLAHMVHVDLHRLRQETTQEDTNEALRVQYILGNIEKEEMSKDIYRKDVARRKALEQVQVYEILNEVGVDLFIKLSQSGTVLDVNSVDISEFVLPSVAIQAYEDLVKKELGNYHELRIYCNAQFAKIGKTYYRKAPFITETWEFTRV